MRRPVALRDLMIAPVRSGYVGDGHPQDSALVPMAGSEAVPNVHVDEVYLPVTDGVARCQLYRPAAAPADQHLPVIVYYHGGGFTVGSSDDCDFLSRKLALTNDAVVVSANYRMAPEFPFPTPFDDAYDVYSWVVDNTHEIDGDSARIAVAGDSAGHGYYFFPNVFPQEDTVYRLVATTLAEAFARPRAR
ncbi:alpha/beta hydrolase fold domain-containing protein [Mycobacterium sp. AZCC_0083]|uniref:alpha/beta hydrolase n=1 Tax=Mycobacterium sp. AZCC_0083 TaxID=2735882 RepID=UPI00179B8BA3|nr:alpha/beta hydrolase fold domain-containing protein [Mycobacterium sp. AZCC_0083]MBB5166476.1 acetyl esterase/lipase [Mycobacterium sp. AZCC_0083]